MTHTLRAIDPQARRAFCTGCDRWVDLKPTGKGGWRCRVRYNQIRAQAPSRLKGPALAAMRERYRRANRIQEAS